MPLPSILQAPTVPGVGLIIRFEGFEADAYPDPIAGWEVPTIGYGTTVYANGQTVRRGDVMTREKALDELRQFIVTHVHPALASIPGVAEMSEPMVGALESFACDLGANFYGSDDFQAITQKLRDKDWAGMYQAFLFYVSPGTDSAAGLKRRIAEANLWESGLQFDIKFFRHYDSNNPNHQKTYLTPPPVPATPPARKQPVARGTLTTFQWDQPPTKAHTQASMPCGEMLNFERDGVTYRLVRDASGSVRLVAGTEVMVSLDYDPSGNLLSALLPARQS